MPIEIKELIIKATVAVDWENQTVSDVNNKDAFLRLPLNKEIVLYVRSYFRKNKIKKILFDETELSAFLVEWKDSLIRSSQK
jgi:hypothetical protein